MADFFGEDLQGSRFERVDLNGAQFRTVDLSGAQFRGAQPSLDAVLELRRDRMSTVGRVIAGLTGQSLNNHTEPVEGPGWPEPRSYPVRECLLVVLNEEWEHRLYAERDLDALEAQRA